MRQHARVVVIANPFRSSFGVGFCRLLVVTRRDRGIHRHRRNSCRRSSTEPPLAAGSGAPGISRRRSAAPAVARRAWLVGRIPPRVSR